MVDGLPTEWKREWREVTLATPRSNDLPERPFLRCGLALLCKLHQLSVPGTAVTRNPTGPASYILRAIEVNAPPNLLWHQRLQVPLSLRATQEQRIDRMTNPSRCRHT